MLQGKQGVILGVANERSIAWAIAEAAHESGARLILNYQSERLQRDVSDLAARLPGTLALPCDLSSDDQIDSFFQQVNSVYGGKLDFLIHSVAFSKKEELGGRFMDTSRDGFNLALEISAYTLVAAARRAQPLMQAAGGGSIVSLSYYGAEKVVKNYNVMGVAKAALECSTRYLASDLGIDGIRVNAISAGPIKTLAARGISGFAEILTIVQEKAPLRRNIELGEVAQAAIFLCAPGSRGITGETLHVDCGFNIIAV